MKIYSKIVNKHFKLNKLRNISTIIGITLSIILFIIVSYISNYITDINIEKSIKESGNYEAIFKDVDKNNIKKIIYNVNVESYGFYNIEYEQDLSNELITRNFEIYALDNNSINTIFRPLITIKEGNLPSKSSDLALTYTAKNFFNKNIGDTIEFNNKQYRIVGFYEDTVTRLGLNLTGITFLDFNEIDGSLNIPIKIKNNQNSINKIDDIGKILNVDKKGDIIFNKNLFYSYGIEFNIDDIPQKKYSPTMLIIKISILLLTALFTYSSIDVSLKERIKDFAALRCMGAIPHKIRFLLIKESFIIGILTLIPGLFLGQLLAFLISGLVYGKIIGINSYGLDLKFYPSVILTTILFTFLTISLSTIIPILKANKISPIQGLKSDKTLYIKVRKRKSKIIMKIFGYKGALAYKNIGNNNKTFIIITSILTVLLVIFTIFTWYYSLLISEYSISKEKSFDIAATYPSYNIIENELINIEDLLNKSSDLKSEIKSLGYSTDILGNVSTISNIAIKGMKINPTLKVSSNIYNNLYQNSEILKFSKANILVYDDDSIESIIPYISNPLRKENLQLDSFNTGFVVLNTAYGQRISPLIEIKDEKIKLYLNEEEANPITVEYLGSIDNSNLISANKFGYYYDLTIIVSNTFIKNNINFINNVKTSLSNINININVNDINNKLISQSELERQISLNGGFFINENTDLIRDKNHFDAMALLIYITLFLTMSVGAINIINTRSINIIIRQKEFGSLLAIGMSKKNLKKLIMLEGIVQWFISSILGALLSIIIVIVLNFIFIFSNDTNIYALPYTSLFIGIIILLIINILSSLLPYNRLSKVDVTELLRNDE